MNGVSLSDPVGRTEAAYAAFADQLAAFIAASVDLESWAAKIVVSHLATLGYGPGADVGLDVYLGKARARRLGSEAAFRLLVGEVFPDQDCTELVGLCLARPQLPPPPPPATPEEQAAIRAEVKALYDQTP